MPGARWRRRVLRVAPLAVALAVVATGCDTEIEGDDDDRLPVVLVVSETWVANNQGSGAGSAAGGEAVQARVQSLTAAVERLRKETGTGWTGRQDDVTGYLGDLSGGSWPGTPSAFMNAHGPGLFGVDAGVLRLQDPDTETIPGVTTTVATQAVGDVPVLDARLVFCGRGSAAGTDTLRVTGIRGRVFPGLSVDTTPTLTPEQAATTAAELAGGAAEGDPTLVVVPTDSGVLAWEVVVLVGQHGTTASGRYYVDATTGELVLIRPVSMEVAPPMPGAQSLRASHRAGRSAPAGVRTPLRPAQVGSVRAGAEGAPGQPEPNSVEVTGADPLGRELTAFGLQTPQGVELVDSTTPSWDSATRKGGVSSYDASRIRDEGFLPGDLWVSPDTRVTDGEIIAAQAYSRDIVDYFRELGRDSWDDAGGSLVSSVKFGPADFCNAFFAGYLRQPQMVYGNPCTGPQGQISSSLVEPDVAAHEVTHGVTQTTANLLYGGQSGALNESFSDYFGNVIGNLIHGNDSVAVAEDTCVGVPVPSSWCNANPDGSHSLRYMLSGNDYDDYLRVLNPGLRLDLLGVTKQDRGGVHFNSRIWNTALWTIRTQLAKIDNQSANTSPLARAFDRAVYGALATRLAPVSGFLDARAAVEQVIIDSQLEPVVLRIARETFDQLKICAGCPATPELAGDAVATTPHAQMHPSVSGDRVLWLDLSTNDEVLGYAASVQLGSGGAPALAASPDSLEVGFAGDAIVALDIRGRVTRTDDAGATTVLDSVDPVATVAAGFAGSDAGAAWLGRRNTIRFVDPAGTVTFTDLTGLAGDTVSSIGTGGGTVAAGTDQGKVLRWTPGAGGFEQVGQLPGAVLAIATHGGNVLAIDDTNRAVLVTADGRTLNVSNRAYVLGATMSEDYAVWSEATGQLEAGVVPGGISPYPETDLYLLSLETGKIYNLHPATAQQGFPSISGRRLVWQDAAYGGDDVFTTILPEGL